MSFLHLHLNLSLTIQTLPLLYLIYLLKRYTQNLVPVIFQFLMSPSTLHELSLIDRSPKVDPETTVQQNNDGV